MNLLKRMLATCGFSALAAVGVAFLLAALDLPPPSQASRRALPPAP